MKNLALLMAINNMNAACRNASNATASCCDATALWIALGAILVGVILGGLAAWLIYRNY